LECVSYLLLSPLFQLQYVSWKKDDIECVTLLKHIQYKPGANTTGLPIKQWDCQLLKMMPAAYGKKGKILELEDNLDDLGIILVHSNSGSTPL
jgi:hypothetical protein